jgi:hypothetical protein
MHPIIHKLVIYQWTWASRKCLINISIVRKMNNFKHLCVVTDHLSWTDCYATLRRLQVWSVGRLTALLASVVVIATDTKLWTVIWRNKFFLRFEVLPRTKFLKAWPWSLEPTGVRRTHYHDRRTDCGVAAACRATSVRTHYACCTHCPAATLLAQCSLLASFSLNKLYWNNEVLRPKSGLCYLLLTNSYQLLWLPTRFLLLQFVVQFINNVYSNVTH